jgi:hypothetical protein
VVVLPPHRFKQALKVVEDGFRFDVTDVDSAPKSAANKAPMPAAGESTTKK